MGIRDLDHGARVFMARLRGLSEGAKLTMGIHADTGAPAHPSGGNIANIAGILEMGTLTRGTVSYIRSTIDEQRASLAIRLADAGAVVLEKGGGQVEAFGPVALELANDMQSRVPVDTGTVRRSIQARVNGTAV